MTVSICTDNEKIDEDIELFNQALSKDDELLSERLKNFNYTKTNGILKGNISIKNNRKA